MKYLVGLWPLLLVAGAPMISELQPRGAQKGRPFKLAVVEIGRASCRERVWRYV